MHYKFVDIETVLEKAMKPSFEDSLLELKYIFRGFKREFF